MRKRPIATRVVLLCMLAAWTRASAADAERKPYKGIFRINTTISAGTMSPEEVVQEARRHGAKVLVFTDQFVCRGEWGLWPLRNLVRFARDRQSVVTLGFPEYVRRMDKLARENPDMVILTGLDVAPHYYWEGSAFRGTLTVHQWSEQLTLVPVSAEEPFAVMPVVANPNQRRHWGVGSVLLLWPLGLVVFGVVWRQRGTVTYTDEQGETYRIVSRSRRWLSATLIAAGMVSLLNNAPFSLTPACSPYRCGDPQIYQQFIDWTQRNTSAMLFWSAPEITMRQEMLGVRLVTEPYVEDITATHGVTGFAGIYGDVRTMHLPGKAWDAVLLEYCAGKRDRPLWALGERDFHGSSRIDGVQTVFLLPELSREAVVQEGLRGGKMYAMCYSAGGPEIVLEEFSVSAASGPKRPAFEDLDADEGAVRIAVGLRVAGPVKKETRLVVTLVRNGEEIGKRTLTIPTSPGETRQTLSFDDAAPEAARSYYRFIASWPGGEIVSNPIFVNRQSRKTQHG